ncbi:MAG: response regulator [Mariprofundaceae bacterium]|nr:response regulator [Mariprofundaceae bacterium]
MKYITTGEAAEICGVRVNTIKRWIKAKEIDAIRTPGGHWRITRDAFIRFLNAYHIQAPDALLEPQEKHRILVVDDDPGIQMFVRDTMEMAPFPNTVDEALDGYTGLVKIGLIRPRLLVLDIMMPEINGLEVLQRLKAEPELWENMSILVLTGAQDHTLLVRKLKEAGPDAILFKPVGVQELLQTVTRLIVGQQPAGNTGKLIHAD